LCHACSVFACSSWQQVTASLPSSSVCAVRWYFRFSLSLRDIEDLLLGRGVVVTYETIRCWCNEFGTGFAQRSEAARSKLGSARYPDEMFVTLRGEPYLLWRAVGEHGTELDAQVQKWRDKTAVKRFFRTVLRSTRYRAKLLLTSCALSSGES
jgi:putative transposase